MLATQLVAGTSSYRLTASHPARNMVFQLLWGQQMAPKGQDVQWILRVMTSRGINGFVG